MADLKQLLDVPDTHDILFMHVSDLWCVEFVRESHQGGGTLQFAAVPLNLFSDGANRADFVITG